jgi:hypothetical protein
MVYLLVSGILPPRLEPGVFGMSGDTRCLWNGIPAVLSLHEQRARAFERAWHRRIRYGMISLSLVHRPFPRLDPARLRPACFYWIDCATSTHSNHRDRRDLLSSTAFERCGNPLFRYAVNVLATITKDHFGLMDLDRHFRLSTRPE